MVDGYTEVYDPAETSEILIDILVGVGAALVGFTALIALVVLWRLMTGKPIFGGARF